MGTFGTVCVAGRRVHAAAAQPAAAARGACFWHCAALPRRVNLRGTDFQHVRYYRITTIYRRTDFAATGAFVHYRYPDHRAGLLGCYACSVDDLIHLECRIRLWSILRLVQDQERVQECLVN